MLEDDRECRDIIQQLTAIHAAVQNATTVFISSYAKECLLSEQSDNPATREEMVDELLDLMTRAGARR
jgi:DNA-binding FrmR family transcriptional regulator